MGVGQVIMHTCIRMFSVVKKVDGVLSCKD